MASERLEWVEIIEPRTKEHMYANLTTGECVWDPPPGVRVKKTDNNQWWELFDQSTSRFYYYNATSQKTVWHRPTDCDIIPLAKLQTLKQNTEPANSGGNMDSLKCGEVKRKETVSTQTQTPTIGACKPHSPGTMADLATSPLSPSPSSRRHHHHHHHHHHQQSQSQPQNNGRHRDHPSPGHQQHQQQQQQQQQQAAPQVPPPARRHHNHSQDSGRSSDSSISHSRTSLESNSYRQQQQQLLDSPAHQQQRGIHQRRSPGQQSTPPPPPSQPPPQRQHSLGNTLEMRQQREHGKQGTLESVGGDRKGQHSPAGSCGGMSMSTSTPLFKKKSLTASAEQQQRDVRRDVSLDFDKPSRNGGIRNSEFREILEAALRGGRDRAERDRNAFASQHPDSSGSSPYRESPSSTSSKSNFRSQHSVEPFSYSKPQPDSKYRSLNEAGATAASRSFSQQQQQQQQRDRVNSLDKSNPPYYVSRKGQQQQQETTGSIGRRHGPLPEPPKNSISGRGGGLQEIPKQRSFHAVPPPVAERDNRRNPATCNNLADGAPQPLARSFSFVQQQQQQQQQAKALSKQLSSSRRRDRHHDDDAMHERYLVGGGLDQSPAQLIDGDDEEDEEDDDDEAGPGGGSSSPSGESSEQSDTGSASNNSHDEEVDDEEAGRTRNHARQQHHHHHHHHPDQRQQRGQQEASSDGVGKKKRSNGNPSPPSSPFYGNLLVDADHLLPLQHYILQQAKQYGCYKFGDPLLPEECDDSLDEEGGGGGESHARTDDDSDDQFADDEAASNQGDSSSQEYLEDHYADLANYDTAGLATYYNTADSLNRPQATPPPPPNIASQAEARENIMSSSRAIPTPTVLTGRRGVGGATGTSSSGGIGGGGGGVGFSLSGLGSTCVDTADYDEAGRRDEGGSGDIEKYAQDNLNLNCGRPKGLRLLFRKKFSVRDILSWSKDPIPQPMLVVVDGEKLLKREACNLFRLVQVYMGDRKANVGMTLDGVAMEIVNTIYSKPALRDELYVQICRQTTENPRKESLRRGWELMAVCLAFVPPSATFEPYLEGYMNRHRDPNFQFPEVAKWPIHVQVSHYATVACKRLQRIGANGKRQPRKATAEDIDQARLQIFRASMFGATLSEVMALQRDRFPQRELPWIQTTLTRQVLIRGGTMTEGIFRVSADADEVNVLKSRLDKFEDGAILAASQDAHAPASLLKLWVRELYEPLIPDSFYAECVAMRHDDPDASAAGVAALVERLPELNRRVLSHLIHFLQIFSRPDVVARTKMDASNLAMVMAPNILRCTSQDPRVILENARKEMAFVRTMIETLKTAWVEDLH